MDNVLTLLEIILEIILCLMIAKVMGGGLKAELEDLLERIVKGGEIWRQL